MIRQPAVAGRFYPGSRDQLETYVDSVVHASASPVQAVGVVSPHAGYVYSGAVAGQVFSEVEVTPTVLLLGPNHTGYGARAALQAEGAWRTPLGDVEIDERLAAKILASSPLFRVDGAAHAHEHCLEVQVPFLQRSRAGVKIVPLVFMLRDIDDILEIGQALGSVLKGWHERVLMVASSDMTHYEAAETARKKDALAIEKVLALDPKGLLAVTAGHHISMCGAVPTAIMLEAARQLGATSARQVAYANSGEVSGDFSSVVGYAGILVA